MKTTNRQAPLHLQPPGRSATAQDAASERDREYFAAHPDRTVYVRRRIPGEFGVLEDDPTMRLATHTEVEEIAPGCRTRSPIWLIRHSDYPNGLLPAEHVEALADYAVDHGHSWRLIGDDEMDDEGDDGGDPRAS